MRVMAMAWSKSKVGRAVGDVVVRDPVVLTATLPRFLLVGDRGNIQLEIDNVEGAAGDYRVGVEADGPVTFTGGAQTLRLGAKERRSFSVPLSTSGAGTAAIKVSLAGPAGLALERNYSLTTNPATQILARRTVKPIARGESLTCRAISSPIWSWGTGSVSVSVGPSTRARAATILQAPMLSVRMLRTDHRAGRCRALRQRLHAGPRRTRHGGRPAHSRCDRAAARAAGSNGSFGLWSVGGDAWLTPTSPILRHALANAGSHSDVAFCLRSIACATSPPTRWSFKEERRDRSPLMRSMCWRVPVPPPSVTCAISPIRNSTTWAARCVAQVGGARHERDRGRADRVYGGATSLASASDPGYGRPDYGSAPRDAAAVVTLTAENGASQATILNGAAGRNRANATQHRPRERDGAGCACARKGGEDLAQRRWGAGPSHLSNLSSGRLNPLRIEIPAKEPCRRWCRSTERRSRPNRCRKGLQDRAKLLHGGRRSGRRHQGEAEHALLLES